MAQITEPTAQLDDSFRATIPSLRRFARAIIGDQREADIAVLSMMSAYANDSSNINCVKRTDLYRSLLMKVKRLGRDDRESPKAADFTPVSRQAHLLVNVEGFANSEVSQILSISTSEVAAHLACVERDILALNAESILIIEDDSYVAMELEYIVRDLGHDVSGIAATHSDAVRQVRQRQPTLILSDVQLADGSSGISAVEEIMTFASVPVVFITTHPEVFFTGTRSEPLFVIRKPFMVDSVRATISQALFLGQQGCLASTF